LTRVLIVDDEVVFRNSIRAMLDWSEHGFDLCGEASDGISAKHRIERLEPDIVITDIKMLGVDGLSLIAYLYDNYPDIQVIAISGYDDYEYVRTSLKHGVVDYLLKHSINKLSLLSVLQAAQKRIRRAKESKRDSERLQKQIAFGRKVIRQRFLIDLLEGRCTDSDEIGRQVRELSLPIGAGIMMLVAAEIDGMSVWKSQNTQGEWQALFDKIMELINENLPKEAMLVPRDDSGFAILFSMGDSYSELSFFKTVSGCIGRIRTALKRHYNVTACYSISGHVSSPDHLKEAYEKARAALGEKIYRESDIVIHDRTIPKSDHRNYDIDFDDEQHIIQLLKTGSRQGIIDYIEDIFQNIRDSGLDSLRVQLIFAHLTNLLNRTLREYGADLLTVYPDFHDVYQNLQHMNLGEMQQGVLDCYISTMEYMKRFGETQNHHEVTRQAIIYINQNYINDISLDAIAAYAHTSASYLSRVFKEDTGRGVVEYINWIRVEHAKQLIREGVKLNELSKCSGFNSDTYFYTVFKNSTGKTPKEYKEDYMEAAN
jgi:two-component system response regulator YesN